MIEVLPVSPTDKRQLKRFVTFPFKIYRNNRYWVPPLIKDEMATLNPKLNPVFRNSDAFYFLAYKDGGIAGRVAVIINHVEINELGKNKVRFGWFDVIDDVEVSRSLMKKVMAIGQQYGLEYAEGPVGFSNLEKAGILTDGFEELNTMITWYHHPYYAKHFEQLGFDKQATWVEYQIDAPDSIAPKVKKFSKLVKERYSLEVIRFKQKKDILPYVDAMFELLNNTYNSLQTFIPIKQYQIDYYKEKYFSFIHPDYITCIKDKNDRLIAFSVVMPSFSNALKKANGRLFPLGWYHVLRAQKKNDTAAFYLIGVDPMYQGKGVTAIIFEEMQDLFNKKGIKKIETNPELQENTAIQLLWKDYNPRKHKERSTFRKSL